MKTCFDNHQVCHVWAQQTQREGYGSKKNIFFEGRTIYSYGYHFPMAIFLDAATVLLNTDSYSVSTSRHQSYVRNAISHKVRLGASTAILKAFASYKDDNPHKFPADVRDAIVKEVLAKCGGHMQAALKRKKASKREDDIGAAIYEIENAFKIFDFFKAKRPKELEARHYLLTNDKENVLRVYGEKIEKERKAAERKTAKARKARQIVMNETIAKWLMGERGCMIHDYHGPVMLRVRGDNIETSQGAEFPIKHGIKAFKFIRWVKEGKASEWQKNGKRIPLGHFEIDAINSAGDVKAGCHTVLWPEIERIGRELQIYP